MTAPVPPETRAWVLTDGKIGDETQCFGIADALGLVPERRVVAPRAAFALFMPFGPIDPRDGPHRAGSPLAPPYPDIAIAAGRRTVAYLRRLKQVSRRTFTVFVKDPYVGSGAADVIWVPQHDRLRAGNVIATVTPAHRVRSSVLDKARADPDGRLTHLPRPHVALLLGGPSVHHRFSPVDEANLVALAGKLAAEGNGLMVTPSRRTPARLVAAMQRALAAHPTAFVWAGEGANPYLQILAAADAIIVTGDSVNMVAESIATGVPVHVYEPTGGHPKITAYLDRLMTAGAVRRWTGTLQSWSYVPIDATPFIADEIARRYLRARSSGH